MQIWNRRSFLKAGGLTALGLGLNLYAPSFIQRRILAQDGGESRKKMIFIFQRGGNDGVNTLIPSGDSDYNDTMRPSLYIGAGQALDLGNNFASLHPRMAPMMDIYNSTALTGVDGPGNLACIHRVGYSRQSRSHFDSQQYYENGTPGEPEFEEGFLYRKIARTLDLDNNALAATAISSSQMVSLKGRQPIPTLRDPARFRFSGSDTKVRKFVGQLPVNPLGNGGKGTLGLYGGPRDFNKPYRDLVFGTGLALADAMSIVQAAVDAGPYVPEPGVAYNGSLGEKLSNAAMLLKRTPVQIVGVNIGGWDTHTNQGAADGGHGNRLYSVARNYQSLYLDLQECWDDLIIVNMTEFGRTTRENGSGGTDHAEAIAMFVAGGGVKGGVYNCDDQTWGDGDGTLYTAKDRYLRRLTDFRAVFAEIFMKHFGDTTEDINAIFPDYAAAQAANPSDFQMLNFL